MYAPLTLYRVWDAFRGLSFLGKLQLTLLLANVVVSFVAVNITATQRKQRIHHDHQVDAVSLVFGLEFIVFTVIAIMYTITVENTFAFWGLMFLQVECVSFITASCLIGVLSTLSNVARYSLVAFCWVCFFVFLLLQRGLRRTWGWHAYHTVGSNPAAVTMYTRYQFMTAALILDAFHSIFFVTAEEMVTNSRSSPRYVSAYVYVGLCIAMARPLIVCVRRDRFYGAWLLISLYVATGGMLLYYVITMTMARASDDGEGGASGDRPGNGAGGGFDAHGDRADKLSVRGERNLVVAVEWCCVAVRFGLIYACWAVSTVFGSGLQNFFPSEEGGGGGEQRYLIDASSVSRVREASVMSAGSGGAAFYHSHESSSGGVGSGRLQSPRHVPVFDSECVPSSSILRFATGGNTATTTTTSDYGRDGAHNAIDEQDANDPRLSHEQHRLLLNDDGANNGSFVAIGGSVSVASSSVVLVPSSSQSRFYQQQQQQRQKQGSPSPQNPNNQNQNQNTTQQNLQPNAGGTVLGKILRGGRRRGSSGGGGGGIASGANSARRSPIVAPALPGSQGPSMQDPPEQQQLQEGSSFDPDHRAHEEQMTTPR